MKSQDGKNVALHEKPKVFHRAYGPINRVAYQPLTKGLELIEHAREPRAGSIRESSLHGAKICPFSPGLTRLDLSIGEKSRKVLEKMDFFDKNQTPGRIANTRCLC